MYRLYNRMNGEHLYTTSENEKDVLFQQHGWGYEGVAWNAPDTGTPVYRLYNAGLQNHLYTSDVNEVQVLTAKHGWIADNNAQPVFYSGGDIPIYRVYNQKLRGLHHWTTDQNEYAILPSHGWQQEGIKFYATTLGAPIQTQYAQSVPVVRPVQPIPLPTAPVEPIQTETPYYPNCKAVRAAGKAPLYRGQPGYGPHLDRDGDGTACERTATE
ncbi:calcium-binding protein [Streptococcus sp. zg-86]|uniref:Calcium-binding protein n=1 Tax=Streptococcus zhangguiae TaxID=2664091 RepID=A0A6I4RFY5_9STRE|nr:calcium-binding protein [Streptococcus sp. zg-86]MTB90701.1 calcium-binding protein [Streptococcus sp. zg-36]MWV56304.1 calcium-binding protein [Streptococcus sp. zg-70]QTH48767.1 excalibur calcium-binding domain-containing protein [Streptococcus sp. zg-86]